MLGMVPDRPDTTNPLHIPNLSLTAVMGKAILLPPILVSELLTPRTAEDDDVGLARRSRDSALLLATKKRLGSDHFQ